MSDRQMTSNGHTRHVDSKSAIRLTIPIPVVDNAGMPFLDSDVRWFEEALMQIASGFRKHLRVRGAWGENGTLYEEPIAVYVTTIEASRLAEVVVVLEQSRRVFRQQAIWAEWEPVTALLLTETSIDNVAGGKRDDVDGQLVASVQRGHRNGNTNPRRNGHRQSKVP